MATVDADGQHTPKSVGILLEEAAKGKSDVVIGADLARGSAFRMLAWRLHRKFSGLALGI